MSLHVAAVAVVVGKRALQTRTLQACVPAIPWFMALFTWPTSLPFVTKYWQCVLLYRLASNIATVHNSCCVVCSTPAACRCCMVPVTC